MSDSGRIIGSGILKDKSDILVAAGVVIIIMMMIIPMPTILLDLFMALNLMLALLVVLTVLYTKRPLDFSIFPALLLVSTVYGLALNVSSTRLILKDGANFDGKMVRAFASFVVGTSGPEGLVIGFIIFIILIAVQFIVITKGATRIAEVAARFTLDSLPGKQMAIDNEYSSGAITEEEASKKKSDLQRETDFYGAMDGASKFIQGNVIVGILITFINIIGGLIVGMIFHNEPFSLALNNYISLTIGDGLVSQFPALLISTSTGLIVTRAISDSTFGKDVTKQFTSQSKIYWIASVFLIGLSFLPGFPWYILIPLSGLTGYLAFSLGKKEKTLEELVRSKQKEDKPKEAAAGDVSPVVPLDPLSLELGYGLIPLVDKDRGADLLERITRIRREAALEMGLVVPKIRIIDNMRLEPSEYCFKIKGVEVGRGSIKTGHYLCINPGGEKDEIEGEKTVDPAFRLPARWITEEKREAAERMGYTVVDPPSIIATHLTELLKRHSSEILGRQEVQSIMEALKQNYPAVVDETTKSLSTGEIQKVLQALLKEQVSIRNMVAILETLSDYAGITKDTSFLGEKVRQALGRQLCLQYADEKHVLHVLTVSPDVEQYIVESRVDTAAGPTAALEPEFYRAWILALSNAVKKVQDDGYLPVLLCSESARALVKSSTARELPDLVVLSVPEITREIKLEALGEVKIELE
jgi:flagellar biosynthesis protein FlhA